MALKFKNITAEEITILTELRKLQEGKDRGKTIMLMQNSTGLGFKVITVEEEDPGYYRVLLKGPNGEKLKPRVSAREVPLYSPLWR